MSSERQTVDTRPALAHNRGAVTLFPYASQRPVDTRPAQAHNRGEVGSWMMRFLRRLFRRQEKPKPADRDAARKHWEAEVADDRKRRGTPEKRP